MGRVQVGPHEPNGEFVEAGAASVPTYGTRGLTCIGHPIACLNSAFGKTHHTCGRSSTPSACTAGGSVPDNATLALGERGRACYTPIQAGHMKSWLRSECGRGTQAGPWPRWATSPSPQPHARGYRRHHKQTACTWDWSTHARAPTPRRRQRLTWKHRTRTLPRVLRLSHRLCFHTLSICFHLFSKT